MTVYGKGSQKRAFLNISDTINCVSIACENPPKKENLEFSINLLNFAR